MDKMPIRLTLIVGSTREGRFGDIVARWFARVAGSRPDFVVDYLDLVEAELPAHLPRRPSAAVVGYADRIARAEAFVVVTPEYNHGYPASLKQAIDLLDAEWRAKPVGFVSYGGISGGLRAVEQLRQVFAELHAVSIRDTVSFHLAQRQFDEGGQPIDSVRPGTAATKLLDQLAWWATALRNARAQSPYAA